MLRSLLFNLCCEEEQNSDMLLRTSKNSQVVTGEVVTVVMAGGKGSRLEPLTIERAKPAVPFGGCYRIIDFTLSNCINSGLRRILVLTQYKSRSLDRHLLQGWQFLNRTFDEFVDIVPPQQRIGDDWYLGTADAVYQNIYSIEERRAKYVLILSGDHVYQMDYREMIQQHIDMKADATIGCLPVPIEEASEFGVMGINANQRIVSFEEKPPLPSAMPGDPSRALASAGIYLFRADFLYERLLEDANREDSQHDFGNNIIPNIIHPYQIHAFPMVDAESGEALYWKDVGTLDSYYDANMDLTKPNNLLDHCAREWPIRTFLPPQPPAAIRECSTSERPSISSARDSILSNGVIVEGQVTGSVLSPGAQVAAGAVVENSILLPDVIVGPGARIQNSIIDKGTYIAAQSRVGLDKAVDEEQGYSVTAQGVTVVPVAATL